MATGNVVVIVSPQGTLSSGSLQKAVGAFM